MLAIHFDFADNLPVSEPVRVSEDRGRVLIEVGESLSRAQILDALNHAIDSVLAGGRWFQEWHGDIISRLPPITRDQHLPAHATQREDGTATG